MRRGNRLTSVLMAFAALAGATIFSRFAECDNFLETLGGTGEIWSLTQKADGSIAAAGADSSSKAWAGTFSASGTPAAQKTHWVNFTGKANWPGSAAAVADGGYLLSILTDQVTPGYDFTTGIWLAKLDSSGSLQWQRHFGDSTNWYYRGPTIRTSDGGYVLLTSVKDSALLWSTYLIRLDTAGHDLWAKKFSTGYVVARQVIETSDGGFLAMLSYGDDLLIWRLKGDGTFVSQYRYSSPGVSFFPFTIDLAAIRETSDHGFVIAWASDAGNEDVLIIRLKPDGTVDWDYTYDVAGHDDWAADIVQTADGGFAVAGTVEMNYPFLGNGFFMKIDSTGGIIWQNQYMDYTNLMAVAKKTDGGYLLGGRSEFPSSYTGAVLVSTDSSGEVGSACTYYEPCHLQRHSLVLTRSTTSYTVQSQTAYSTTVGWSSNGALWQSNLLCTSPTPSGPTITKIKSRTSKPGKPATIFGSGFATNALNGELSSDSNKVYFGRYLAEQTRPPTEGRLKVKIPRRLRAGMTVLVKVVTNGKESNKVPFEVK